MQSAKGFTMAKWSTLIILMAVLASGCELAAWGGNSAGQVGNGTSGTDVLSPIAIAGDDWAAVDSLRTHTCGVKTDKTLWCWGDNSLGQLGDGTTTDRPTPTRVGTSSDWTKVAVGRNHSCGIRSGELWCWGRNDAGQVGDGTTTHRSSPVRVGGFADWKVVALGARHSCGIRGPNYGYCWGLNDEGQVGDGSNTDRTSPVRIQDNWSDIAAGTRHSCGIQDTGIAWCWGSNADHQLGSSSLDTVRSLSPDPVCMSFEGPCDFFEAESVSTGALHTCAVSDRDGPRAAYCWGSNSHGQLGHTCPALVFPWFVPNPCTLGTMALDGWSSVDAGRNTTCGMFNNNVWCWGQNSSGQVGDGTTNDAYAPYQATTGGGWFEVSTGLTTVATRL